MSAGQVFRVALDMPLRRVFDYLAPQITASQAFPVAPGSRVRVPFGRQRLVGVVTEVADSSDVPPERLKPILGNLGTVFFLGTQPGMGHTMKLLNNVLSATAMAISSEAVVMGVKAGLDVSREFGGFGHLMSLMKRRH